MPPTSGMFWNPGRGTRGGLALDKWEGRALAIVSRSLMVATAAAQHVVHALPVLDHVAEMTSPLIDIREWDRWVIGNYLAIRFQVWRTRVILAQSW